MYDLAGGDSGREWVEITNTGSESVDIAKYRLFENGTNHGFTLVAGTAVLQPGASAILADDAEKFKTDWPSFAGTIFNTAFSLSNTGETLSLKTGALVVEDTVTYIASAGAAGDGGSLQKSGVDFVAALPSPGVYPSPLAPVPKVTKSTPTKTTTKSTSRKTTSVRSQAAAAVVPQETIDLDAQNKPSQVPLALWVAGLVAIIGLGTTGAVYARLSTKNEVQKAETVAPKEEFEIE